jgi:hypothetical protein
MVIIMNEYNENGRNTSNDDYGERKPVCDRQIVLNAASGGAGPLPLITTLLASPINVVSVAIDTTGMGNTNNLLTFTGTINLPLGISVTLNFQIQRVKNNGTAMNVGSSYTFSTTVNVLESEAFSFQFMDKDTPEAYYLYSVNLSTNSIIDITPGATVNGVLSIHAVTV